MRLFLIVHTYNGPLEEVSLQHFQFAPTLQKSAIGFHMPIFCVAILQGTHKSLATFLVASLAFSTQIPKTPSCAVTIPPQSIHDVHSSKLPLRSPVLLHCPHLVAAPYSFTRKMSNKHQREQYNNKAQCNNSLPSLNKHQYFPKCIPPHSLSGICYWCLVNQVCPVSPALFPAAVQNVSTMPLPHTISSLG